MKSSLRYAFKLSLPVLSGYLFMGFSFGVILSDADFSWYWSTIISMTVYCGSMQFALVPLLTASASLLTVFIVTFTVNCRHMFYGISFLDRFKGYKVCAPYIMFTLTDETYALLNFSRPPVGLNQRRTDVLIAFLDHIYWIIGCTLGGIFGQVVDLNLTGIDFSMTALFVVVFVDQFKNNKNHLPVIFGFVCSIAFLLLLGAKYFLLPSLVLCMILLLVFKKRIEPIVPIKKEEKEEIKDAK